MTLALLIKHIRHFPLITVSHSLCNLSILKVKSETASDKLKTFISFTLSFILNYSEKLILIQNITFEQNFTQCFQISNEINYNNNAE